MKIEILQHATQNLLWSSEATSLKGAVMTAVQSGANLGGANLGGANLRGAYLWGAKGIDIEKTRKQMLGNLLRDLLPELTREISDEQLSGELEIALQIVRYGRKVR